MDKYTNRLNIEDQASILNIDEPEIEQDEQKEAMKAAIKAVIKWEQNNRRSSNKLTNAIFKQLKEAIR